MAEQELEAALYLIPVTLGDTEFESVLPERNRAVISGIRHFIVENRRSAIRFLKMARKDIDIDSLSFTELSEHTEPDSIAGCLAPLERDGLPIGVISEAGCPAVADPGALAVELAQEKGLRVIPLSGPSSIILSLMASGFCGQNFCFNGYLSAKPSDRQQQLRRLESRAWKEGQTQIFIEAPYRNAKMIQSIFSSLRKETRVCIAAGLTTEQEFVRARTVEQWKKSPPPELNKIPAIFLIYKGASKNFSSWKQP